MKEIQTLVEGSWVMTDPRLGSRGILREASVAVSSEGRVEEVGDQGELRERYPGADLEGGPDLMIMPGLIDAHSHGSGLSYLELGLGYDHLEYWNTYLDALPRPDPYLDTLWCGIKHLRSGCTTIHHMSNMATQEAIQTALRAYHRLGIRWALSLTVKDQNLVTYDDRAFRDDLPAHLSEAFESAFLPQGPRVRRDYFQLMDWARDRLARSGNPVGHGPMGPQWCSRQLLERIAQDARSHQTRVHMHALQTPYQRESVWRAQGQSAISYLQELGLLQRGLVLGHAVWLEEGDLEMMASAGAALTHHASCNLNMRNGILPLAPILAQGISVGIGIDGKGINDDEDMIQEMRVIEKLHRLSSLSPGAPRGVTPQDIVVMATVGGAEILGIGDTAGTLEPGKAADLIAVDMRPRPYLHPQLDPYEILVMSRKASDIRLVMVEGKAAMRDGVIPGVEEDLLLQELVGSIGQSSAQGWEERARLMDQLRPHLVKLYSGWEGTAAVSDSFYTINRKR